VARSGAHSLSAAARNAAIADAVAVGKRLGLAVDAPVVLSDNLNLIVHLRPSPVVARVAVRTQRVRSVAVLGDSLGLVTFLAGRGLPVAPPTGDVDPGPHIGPATGRAMTLWRLLEEIPDELIDPSVAGATLQAIHAAGAGFRGPLRHDGPLAEVERLADLIPRDRPADADRIRRFRAAIVVPAAPTQAVHGDAHLGNVLATSVGQVWIDWEESWLGPVAWDLACLDHRRRVFGEQRTEIGAAFAAYGEVDEAAIDAWAPVVALWALAWGTAGAIELHEDISDNAKTRLRWLEARFG
jgi:Ser/Thr protein kinase RdoA (MazF antagonist)